MTFQIRLEVLGKALWWDCGMQWWSIIKIILTWELEFSWSQYIREEGGLKKNISMLYIFVYECYIFF